MLQISHDIDKKKILLIMCVCIFSLPTPMLPSFEYFNDVIGDIFIIALVTFAMTASLVKVYATEFGYDVLYNQVSSDSQV